MLNDLRKMREAVKSFQRSSQLVQPPPEHELPPPSVAQAPQQQLALLPPPGQQGGVVALPLPMLPPPAQAQAVLTTDTEISTFLGQHIRPREDCARCVLRQHIRPRKDCAREDCARCEVARTNLAARQTFGDPSEVGNGRTRDMARSRACPLAAHGVTKRQIAELLGPVTSLQPMAKRAKVAQYMQEVHGVTPLGREDGAKPYLVSLYQQNGGQYEVAGRQTDFYQGFELV